MDEVRLVHRRARKKIDVRPFTKQELDAVIAEMGETDNFQEAGWIFPDGRMPNMHRTEETYFDKDFN